MTVYKRAVRCSWRRPAEIEPRAEVAAAAAPVAAAYYWLYPTSRELPFRRRVRRWVGPPLIKIYSRYIRRSPLRRPPALSPEACGWAV